MTKEELEHNHIKEIAENYVNECWGTYLDLGEVDLVLAGIGVAKIISKEKEERIKELEKENAELNNFIMQSKKDGISPVNTLIIKNLGNQLTKAKEIIKDLLSLKSTVSSAEDVRKRFSVRERAEDFLKENET